MNSIQPQSTLFRRRDGHPQEENGSPYGASSSPMPLQPRSNAASPSAPLHTNAAQEQENDALMQALLADMRRTKKGFTKLGDEVREQNALLEKLKLTFRSAQGSLRKTMLNLDKIGWGSFKHMWILALFVIVFFMLLYLMLKFR
ncbi:putative BET1-like protein [Leptomonas pyrrhocoris]|uniref:Putative BET1-like protein n=1 Tax=Leptomonas pyrrhocoris TaxID=157538 RepID=A0A0N0DVH8_LEPPY|nr:putative BET1-like protein [Leptomonas pyrrhocoris]XP_015658812.1 putative BET1-like protein [Leptomonas pyrrhocoris]KPA80372.1 putative BET1-like protein [Leptomonas pyrrhocoris]KPA80373.1 putative BET1-like protein [Leptomonas pyrrhocoris]|eukprot:XP_015658811.1 putative BET1-like protein [Leptomonas pyrrhocoris]